MYEIVYIYRKRLIINLLGGDSRIRTGDPMLAKHMLYQLSYIPVLNKKAGLVSGFFVGPGRVELPTSTLSV